jgi:hypothetical protein
VVDERRFIVPEVNLESNAIGTLDDGFDRRLFDPATG